VKTLATVALLFALAFIVTGGLAVAVLSPWPLAVGYGCVGSVAMWAGLDLVGEVWAAV
jgi:hypothetical protein